MLHPIFLSISTPTYALENRKLSKHKLVTKIPDSCTMLGVEIEAEVALAVAPMAAALREFPCESS